jgi:TPP-dependent indolepyruvate ferredoxin oxidoreductase alpha subunit
MISEILSNEVGKKIILLGNEAIVRGALESGQLIQVLLLQKSVILFQK